MRACCCYLLSPWRPVTFTGFCRLTVSHVFKFTPTITLFVVGNWRWNTVWYKLRNPWKSMFIKLRVYIDGAAAVTAMMGTTESTKTWFLLHGAAAAIARCGSRRGRFAHCRYTQSCRLLHFGRISLHPSALYYIFTLMLKSLRPSRFWHGSLNDNRSKTLKRLKERFLIRRNRTKRANFRCKRLFQATNNTTENS